MLALALLRLHRLALLVALAVALIATGFAHRMPGPQDEALAIALANGATLADFCSGTPGADHPRPADCLACQIAAHADLPPIAGLPVDLRLAADAPITAPRGTSAPARTRDPARSPQGPPVA